MSAARIAAAVLLIGGVYVVYSSWKDAPREDEPAGAFDALADAAGEAVDMVSETIETFTGVGMGSSRYAAALENPKYAAIIEIIRAAEDRYSIPAGLLVRQAWQESRFNPAAVSPVGAAGLMQFMPATAKEWGVNVADPVSSADGAARYMVWLYKRVGSWSLALAAYNWGIGNVLRKGIDAAPKETRDYVAEIGADTGIA